MEQYAIHESEVKWTELPGRNVKLIIGPKAFGPCKNMSMGIAEFPIGVVAPPHSHEHEEEVCYIVSGEGQLWVGERIETLKRGVCVYVPPRIVHQTRNTGKDILKVLYVFSPPLTSGGRAEGDEK